MFGDYLYIVNLYTFSCINDSRRRMWYTTLFHCQFSTFKHLNEPSRFRNFLSAASSSPFVCCFFRLLGLHIDYSPHHFNIRRQKWLYITIWRSYWGWVAHPRTAVGIGVVYKSAHQPRQMSRPYLYICIYTNTCSIYIYGSSHFAVS